MRRGGSLASAILLAGLAGGCGGGSPARAEPVQPAAPAGTVTGCIKLQLREAPQPATPLPQVFVYIKDGLEGRTFPVPRDPVILDQVTFQFVPRVFGIRAGQTLRITSQDASQHNVFCQPFNNPGFNGSMSAGEVVEKTFAKPEVMVLLQCNLHPIMKAYAGVLDHPFFAVTGDDGTFVIKGLPPGRYKLGAWQEMMGSRDVDLDLGSAQGKWIEIVYK